ncbi:Tumor necrosis factor receptor superfamily member 5 [Anabarilius grahami]|uniref:Tumor necrosis factor receptor superfamily member 5 n=1 Tax=Anabarilius grahami TaxID=495550 RepID=A0A3N0YIW6_ANAGA|nr:Tumor necrosis factor receptor superfamily member 5 [Anabarilius grahami]
MKSGEETFASAFKSTSLAPYVNMIHFGFVLLIVTTLNFKLCFSACARAEYEINGECCPMCAPEQGLRVKRSCTRFADTICEPLEGFYCIEQNKGSCRFAVKHSECDPGHYIRQAGTMVLYDCTGDSSTTCKPCILGTFMSEPSGLHKCFPCNQCDENQGLYIQSKCTTIRDTICDVLDGYHCTEYSNLQCLRAVKHSVCRPGQKTKTLGFDPEFVERAHMNP